MANVSKASKPPKRKKAEDMADSPPKRVTRSRAKAIENTGESLAPTVTKIKTPSLKAIASALSEKQPGATKRPVALQSESQPMAEKTLRSQTKTGKQRLPEDASICGVEATRQPRNIVKKKLEDIAPIQVLPTQVRSKKAAANLKVTRACASEGTTASIAGRASTSQDVANTIKETRPPPRKVVTQTKKVIFQEDVEVDKENQAQPVLPLTAGLQAKPIRKPPAKAMTRSKKSVSTIKKSNGVVQEVDTVKALSPKKVRQVAKSISSEDELASEHSPAKIADRSPVKPISPLKRANERFKDFNVDDPRVTMLRSPPKVALSASLMGSPARRPPPSPYKGSIKESPRKMDVGNTAAISSTNSAISPLKLSLLQSPAKRPQSPTKLSAELATAAGTITLGKSTLLAKPLRRSPVKSTDNLQVGSMNSPSRKVPFKDSSWENASKTLEAHHGPKMTSLGSAPTNLAERSTTPLGEPLEPFLSPGLPDESTKSRSPSTGSDFPTCNDPYTKTSDIQAHQHRYSTPTAYKTAANGSTSSVASQQCFSGAGQFAITGFREIEESSSSEEELQSPSRSFKGASHEDERTPTSDRGSPTRITLAKKARLSSKRSLTRERRDNPMTPLATQLSAWFASSPEKQVEMDTPTRRRGVFEPFDRARGETPGRSFEAGDTRSPVKMNFFEDEMIVFDAENTERGISSPLIGRNKVSAEDMDDVDTVGYSALQDDEDFSDENEPPINTIHASTANPAQALAEISTPVHVSQERYREVYTVSKVPLRAAAEENPGPMGRSHSFSSMPGSRHVLEDLGRPLNFRSTFGVSYSSLKHLEHFMYPEQHNLIPETPVQESMPPSVPTTPLQLSFPALATPRTLRTGGDAQILRGAVVYVDVHTSEGADASSIFVELLTSMGARCIKQWTWNSRASLGTLQSSNTDSIFDCPSPDSKVGITHVVFKDGGKRTLEKVKESKGLVMCVGVGWVLDCEAQNKWLDETEYSVDTSMVPRGGHRRRKSMEPKALINMNGSLSAGHITPARQAQISPTKEFLNFSSSPDVSNMPSSSLLRPVPETPAVSKIGNMQDDVINAQSLGVIETPNISISMYPDDDDATTLTSSPETNHHFGLDERLLQKTCPPKQRFQTLLELEQDDAVRRRLVAARRKSLQFAPKIRSPLGRWEID
ncbi:hypothetical protein MMC25_004791 [Agyrium rufum]|nr:hypothetical protein [Agyrium rufum]